MMDFATYPWDSGQLIQRHDSGKWLVTESAVTGWLRSNEDAVLLPSRAQCEAAALSAWDALEQKWTPNRDGDIWLGLHYPLGHAAGEHQFNAAILLQREADDGAWTGYIAVLGRIGPMPPCTTQGFFGPTDAAFVQDCSQKVAALQAWLAAWEAHDEQG